MRIITMYATRIPSSLFRDIPDESTLGTALTCASGCRGSNQTCPLFVVRSSELATHAIDTRAVLAALSLPAIEATIGKPTNSACPMNWIHHRVQFRGNACGGNSGTITNDITNHTNGPYK